MTRRTALAEGSRPAATHEGPLARSLPALHGLWSQAAHLDVPSSVRAMRWMNYHHLFYFWTVARTGSITAAARELYLSAPAISTQIKLLEEALEAPLFERKGRGLILTEAGRKAYAYADQIFRLGQELQRAVRLQAAAPEAADREDPPAAR